MPAAAILDSVRPLGLECPQEGGTQTYQTPTEITTTQDALAAAGYYIDGPTVTTPDKTTLIDRATGGMRFTDASAQQQLSNIVGAAYNGYQPHSGLPDASHLDAFGPDAGFTSGCVETRAYSGPLLSNVSWWTNSQQAQRVYQVAYSYASGSPLPSTITRTTYTTAGAVLRTFIEQLSYMGPLCTGRTRTWT